MKALRDNWLIQIEITNSCFLECDNCTRFIGHHKKPYFMKLEMIEQAIDSLEGFKGGIGIMGGEPLMHPDFIDICKLIQKKVPREKRYIWTSGYKWKHYRSIVRKTFEERVYYNDHQGNEQKHQPVLMAIEDYLKDRPFMKELIDKCWIQEKWSPSINPKGGFFCEVAAAMDILFEGPGGYPLEKGWWDKSPQQFQDQVERYCYRCSAALPMPPVFIKKGMDYVSCSNYKRLKDLKTPKFVKNRVECVEREYTKAQINDYAKDWQPWLYLGDEPRKSFYAMYGLFAGFLVAFGKKVRKRRNKIKECLHPSQKQSRP
ncbi:MAG: radical SAM protein [Candidatus Omnitrophica bacterium]|nr:radical SAM protein [Candidatus Omnitrophota bacterium]